MKGTKNRCRREENEKNMIEGNEKVKGKEMLTCKRLDECKSTGINRKDGKGKIKKRNIVIIIKAVLTVKLR